MDRLHPHLSRCSAYVEFETPEEAQKALKYMDGGRPSTQMHTLLFLILKLLTDSMSKRGSNWVLLFCFCLWFVTLCAHTVNSDPESNKNHRTMTVWLTFEQLWFFSVNIFVLMD